MKTVFFILLLFPCFISYGQLNDDFTDGDFTNTPTWSGTTADFIVNASKELQISNGTAATTSYLSTPHGLSSLNNQEWHLNVRMPFSPSSGNFSRIYLTATNSDLTTNPDGFFIQLGETGTTDAVRLNKSVGNVVTAIAASPSGQISTTVNVGIRVVRDNLGNWYLFVDPAGGTAYAAPYTGTDASNLIGTHFGVLGTYTGSNASKFYFDNVYVGNEILDTQAPTLTSATAISATQVDVLFSEAVSGVAATTNSNYTCAPTVVISGAAIDGTNGALVHLTLGASLTNGQTYSITVASIQDLVGNAATNLTTNFSYLVGEAAVKGDLLISEIMVDPSPPLGLPEVEFVEIYNASTKYIDLSGWKMGDASGDGTITSGFIVPGEYKIICASSSQTFFTNALVATSFPSYNNSGDDVVLKNPSLQVMDKITYSDDWYQSDIKKAGGYTIELINPNDPCSDRFNWIGSASVNGGTPGAQNSVYSVVPDQTAPVLVSSLALSPNYLQLVFSEGMDSASLVNAVFSSNPNLTIGSVYIPVASSNEATLIFNENLMASQLYTFTLSSVRDCWLNSTTISSSFALAESAVAGDLVINELLFDPGTGGSDFVELFNRSQKVINLNGLQLANYDNDTISNIKTITTNYVLFPNDYVVITADSNYVKAHFTESVSGKFLSQTLPSLNNDSSTFILMNMGVVLDLVSYTSDWQLSLIDDTENKTLERIDPNGISNSKSNWHTAAETVGFGTPGRMNSQYQTTGVSGSFGTTSPIFSPDNDGNQDVLIFFYEMPAVGMIANVTIFDNQGRVVKELLRSELLGSNGNFSWDGVADSGQKAPIGVYLTTIECFSVDNSVKFAKRIAFTLGGNLN